MSNTVDLMVSPHHLIEFAELMNATDAKYELYVEDVQKLIDEENPMTREAGFGWGRYHTLDEIYNWLDDLGRRYSGNVQVVKGGRTYEGRPIKGVKLSFGQSSKPGVFIEGGIHAREWISPATVTYLLNEFLTSNNSEVRKLAEAYDWYMFPSVNPDGYVYSHKGVSFFNSIILIEITNLDQSNQFTEILFRIGFGEKPFRRAVRFVKELMLTAIGDSSG